ncbi:hypothetical protein SAMN05216325_101238 [Nitrosomonas marina]|uniref:Uncharacterized protein n=1 Tax=Nitrosomonas marina TaxID=917 RepID=A0A1H8AQE1_9PROT|nr:hypothetical protein SAMN05216325_101238 [Nitrosomonas marina]
MFKAATPSEHGIQPVFHDNPPIETHDYFILHYFFQEERNPTKTAQQLK